MKELAIKFYNSAKDFLVPNISKMWEYIKSDPKGALLWTVGIYVGIKLLYWLFIITIQYLQSRKLVYMKVTLAREDSQKDKEKETQKDFREKISIMAQFFRNIHETRELNFWHRIKVMILKNNIFSFELVTHNKILEFWVSMPPYYKDLVEKQITSYYPDADIQFIDRFEHDLKGMNYKCSYAYQGKDYWFPLKTYKIVENDPLNALTNIFSKMEDEELAVIQMVIRPCGNKWAKKAADFGDAYFKGKKTTGFKLPLIGPILNVFKGIFLGFEKMEIEPKQGGDGYVRMLQAKEDVAKRLGEKAQQSGFETMIRLLACAKTESRAEEINNNMIISFNLFTDNMSNLIQTKQIFLIDFLNNIIAKFNFKHRLLDTRLFLIGEKKSLFVEEELASIYHFPCSIYNYTPIIKWLDYKVLPAPVDLPTEGILLGHNVYRGEKKEVRFLKKDRSRHHYIIGKSGSGKSVLLNFMARQDIKNGEGVCVIDPHGDLVEDCLMYVPKERAKDVIIFDPSDQERPMGLNILEASTPAEMDLVSSQATEIFIKLFGDEIFGPRIQHYFRNACLTLAEDTEEGATLIDVPRVFTDDGFLKYKVKKVKNPVVRSFWEYEYANTGERERQEMIPYFSSKFGPFITNSIMRNTIGQPKSAFDFRKCMDEGKILLVKLSKGKIGDLNTQLLGLIIVARIQMAAMSRADTPEDKRKDFYLYVDEFQNFATDSFCSILSEARKYHLSLIMAHQYINQLVVSKFGNSSTQIRDAVFGNVGTLCSFKVGAEDAEYLAKEYAPILSEQDVLGISNYKMYIKLNINNTTSRPFSVNTVWDQTGQNKKIAEIVREYSRLKHGRKREFVDQEIAARLGTDTSDRAIDPDAVIGGKKAGGDGGGGGGDPMMAMMAQAKAAQAQQAGTPLAQVATAQVPADQAK